MSERPAVLFGALLTVAGLFAASLVAGLASLGGAGIAGLAATLVGALSACVFFLAELRRVPVTSLMLIAFALASAYGFARALLAFQRQQRLLNKLPLEPLEGKLADIARQAGAPRLFTTPASRPAAFCFGLMGPRIVLTSGLLERLAPDEQAAAVWHEAQHARVREPLRCFLGQLAVGTFFWIPALRDLLERYLLTKELDADRLASARTSQRALAGALYEVIPQPSYIGAIGLGNMAAARIDRLFDPKAELPHCFGRIRLGLTAIAIVALAGAIAYPGTLNVSENAQIGSMLTTASVHGLHAMAIGLALNATLLICLARGARKLARRDR